MNNYDFGLDACKQSVCFQIEELHQNPIKLLGEFTLRAKQDAFFNRTMITALLGYIEEHNIKWSD